MAHILVIDDDELFVKLMCHSLKEKGHTIEFALDGQQGWKAFCNGKFDVIVCDIVMPAQEGFETIKRIRQQDTDVGIVAISGGLSRSLPSNLDVLDIVSKLGANATLKKPFSLSALAACVERVLTRNEPKAQVG
jgi:DNA-binding response OmpR family regulator